MPEKRSQQRLLDCDLVMIGWDGGSKKNNQLGNMTDISLNGIGVRVDHPLPPDTPVTICYESLSNGLILDIVRHHTPGTNEHFLGIEFVAASCKAGSESRPAAKPLANNLCTLCSPISMAARLNVH